MKLAPWFALWLAGCSLYFGPGDSAPGDLPTGEAPTGEAPTEGEPVPVPVPPPAPPLPPAPPAPSPERCGSPEVHVIGVYETSSDHGPGNHPTGDAHVTIERPGDHILVLSAYEPTNWHVELAAGATVRAVQLIGYHTQTVDLPNVRVTHGTGCGYSYPYNGGGCDTNQLLALAEAQAGARITTFHGCYQASDWTLHADRTATSNCNTAAGYQQFELLGRCRGSSS